MSRATTQAIRSPRERGAQLIPDLVQQDEARLERPAGEEHETLPIAARAQLPSRRRRKLLRAVSRRATSSKPRLLSSGRVAYATEAARSNA